MKVALVEDEPLAAEKLVRYLEKYSTDIEVLTVLESLRQAVPWIREHKDKVDLFFMDVQLSDGLSFEIFAELNLDKPIIFTTAFDEFAVDAFKVNSIDYLLKPITFTDLSKALKKFASLRKHYTQPDMEPLIRSLGKTTYKDRFLVKIGNHIRSVGTHEVLVFQAEGRDVSLFNSSGKEYLIEYRLEALEKLLDPKQFFRVNRSFIVALSAIADVVVYSNRRLKLELHTKLGADIVVSREKVAEFKKWFGGQ
ncbi:LytTR family DNA-binding domain-containing protein [Flagellimonas sp. DF-77]|uniref:LytR/AlgR family response regulator transcription factor n=1 Tax=Flagellimonas algarum TaxID=3230298 RepID=UPI0033974ACF